jgi:prepilin-type processing-associated H-X9-DG protein
VAKFPSCSINASEGVNRMTININCPHCGQKVEADESLAGLTQTCAVCGERVTVPGVQNRFPGSQASDRFQFSLRKMLGYVTVTCVLLMFVALLLPSIRHSGEAARRNQCINNLRNIGLALHSHQNTHGRLPLASSEPRTGRPGIGTGPDPAGYSWIVGLLPFIEEGPLWSELIKSNDKLRLTPFDPAGKPELSCIQMQILRCPSYGGPESVRTMNTDYQEYATPEEKIAPAASNYVALVASHFTNSNGLGLLFEMDPQHEFDGNGLLPFPTVSGSPINNGLSLKAVKDGTSKTVMLTESKEQTYSAWIDGQAIWVIGAWQGDSDVPNETWATNGMLGWPDQDKTSCTSLNVGSRVAEQAPDSYSPSPPDRIYLTAERYGAKLGRVWGPSSEHTGGAVNHVFADGHVTSITPSIDRNTYLRIISRDDGGKATLE